MRTLRQFNQATPPNPLHVMQITQSVAVRKCSRNASAWTRKKHAIKNNKIKLIIMSRRQRQREGQRRGQRHSQRQRQQLQLQCRGSGRGGGIVSPGCRIEIAYPKPETIWAAFFLFYFLAAFKKFVAIASTCATFKEPSGKQSNTTKKNKYHEYARKQQQQQQLSRPLESGHFSLCILYFYCNWMTIEIEIEIEIDLNRNQNQNSSWNTY